jgi:hypothetical protein
MRPNPAIRLFAIILIAIALFILPHLWDWHGLPVLIIAALVIATYFLVRWHARHTGYQCPTCQKTFAITATTDFLSPHLGSVKMLRCPHCGHSSWCFEIRRDEIVDSIPSSPVRPASSSRGATSLRLQITFVIIVYLALWAYTLYAWPSIPAATSFWTIFKIPLITAVLPLLQIIFCSFALRQGYRSRLYLFISLFVIVFLVLAVWMQRTILSRLV